MTGLYYNERAISLILSLDDIPALSTIVCGSRNYQNDAVVHRTMMESSWHIKKVIQGGAIGVDESAMKSCLRMSVECVTIRAKWDELGRSAGPIRNRQMAKEAEALIAIWDGKSPGTRDMIEIAETKEWPIIVRFVKSLRIKGSLLDRDR